MTELLWQTTLLLVGTFFLGAVLACGLKRRFYYGTAAKAAPRSTAEPMAAPAPAAPNALQPKIEVSPFPAAPAKPAAPIPAPVQSQLVVPPSPLKVPPLKAQPAPQSETRSPAAAASPAVSAGATGPSHDLTRIRGIDSVLQKRLSDYGVRRFHDIADWTPADVMRANKALNLEGRIEQENWIEQAQILAKGGETNVSPRKDDGVPASGTAASAPPAPAAPAPVARAATAAPAPTAAVPLRPRAERSDVANLRSVRSHALRGDDTATGLSSDIDDLKRIRGVGVLIERKLISLGITSYEQIANWTGADIVRISQILDFKGRIERENWIEQARILATGGQTEFSRRIRRVNA